MNRVSFQGTAGAYSEAAAESFFGDPIQTVPHQSFAGALISAESGESDYTVLPVENLIEGSVGESYDLLLSTTLLATGEVYHRIQHCLIGTGRLEQVTTVHSHPQALGQCRRFIEERSIRQVPAYDTAGSVEIIKKIDRPDTACIASEKASRIYGIPVIARDIADNPRNYTRFLVMSSKAAEPTGRDKTSMIFSIRHEPGSLYGILGYFHEYGINMTKIESRPKKTGAWEYNFYADFEGHVHDPPIQEMLSKIRERAGFLKILGSYPAAVRP